MKFFFLSLAAIGSFSAPAMAQHAAHQPLAQTYCQRIQSANPYPVGMTESHQKMLNRKFEMDRKMCRA